MYGKSIDRFVCIKQRWRISWILIKLIYQWQSFTVHSVLLSWDPQFTQVVLISCSMCSFTWLPFWLMPSTSIFISQFCVFLLFSFTSIVSIYYIQMELEPFFFVALWCYSISSCQLPVKPNVFFIRNLINKSSDGKASTNKGRKQIDWVNTC